MEGLFAAAVDIDLGLPDLDAADPGHLGEVVVRHFLTLWEQPPGKEILLTLLRSAVTDDASMDQVRQMFVAQVAPAVQRTGDPATAPRRAALIASQILGLALCRYVLALPPAVALTPAEIVDHVGPTIQRYLTT